MTESTQINEPRLATARSLLARLIPIPWRNRWFWSACVVIIAGFGALNTRYHSLGINVVATAVPFDGKTETLYPREYGWPWAAILITKVYDPQTMPANVTPLRTMMRVIWLGALGNLAILAAAIFTAGRSYAIAVRHQATGISAAIPFRFSLRSFFIALTLVAAWMGVTLRDATLQKRALDDLRARGAQVGYEYQIHGVSPSNVLPVNSKPPLPWLRDVLGSEWGLRVVNVNLYQVNGDATALLHQLKDVKGVVYVNCPQPIETVDPELLEALYSLPELKQFAVVGASEATRQCLREELPECTIMPHAGFESYADAIFREKAKRALPQDARLREWAACDGTANQDD